MGNPIGIRYGLGVRRAASLRRLSSLSGLLAAALVVSACSSNPEPPTLDPNSPAADIIISAQNQNVNDVDVVLVAGGQSQRLGTVTAQSQANFQVPWSRVANSTRVFVRASPIGSNALYQSQNLVLRPGSQVSVTLNSVIRNSVTTVY